MNPIYVPAFHPTPDAAFADLLKLPWLQVTEARKELFMSAVPRSYTYGEGRGERVYDSQPFDQVVEDVWVQLKWSAVAGYNICFLNRYDDQHNQLGWHADDSPTMDHGHPIAVVSFGAAREIWWKKQGEKGVVPKEQRQVLGHGSLFIMPAGFQQLYFHRIPKADRPCGVRVSLTFRRYQ